LLNLVDGSPNLVFDANSVPYLGTISEGKLYIRAFTGVWLTIPNLHPAIKASNLGMAFGPGNKLFAAYSYGTAYALSFQADTVPAAPQVVSPVVYCQDESAVPLIATGQNVEFSGPSTPFSATPITPSTAVADTFLYFARTINGIFSSAEIPIQVIVHPKPIITAIPDSICDGEIALLSTPPDSGAIYHWFASQNIGGTVVSNSFDSTPTISSIYPGEFALQVSPVGCFSDTVSVYFRPIVQRTVSISGPAVVNVGASVNLTANLSIFGLGDAISWFRNSSAFAVTFTQALQYNKSPGTDSIFAVVSHPGSLCYENDTSNMILIQVPLGVSEVLSPKGVVVYPNPSEGKVHFHTADLMESIEVRSLEGRLILSAHPNSANYTIDLTGKPSGIYFYSLTSEGHKLNGKICLQ
jgi:hypothetical protein